MVKANNFVYLYIIESTVYMVNVLMCIVFIDGK